MIQTNSRRKNTYLASFFAIIIILCVGSVFLQYKKKQAVPLQRVPIPPAATPPVASVSATPTPTKQKPLTFEEMNRLYGPCINLPVLMYHHVEAIETAKENNRAGLDVPPERFNEQMKYLIAKGYVSIVPQDLVNFFDNEMKLPSKPVLITFDDGYVDNGDEAFPIMKSLGVKGTIYIPTGLMDNFDYLTWAKIDEMKSSGIITFGNHTWSHKNVGGSHDTVTKEITTADTQLSDHGLNSLKTFVIL